MSFTVIKELTVSDVVMAISTIVTVVIFARTKVWTILTRSICNFARAYNTAISLHSSFGTEAGKKLQKILSDLEHEQNLSRLISQLKERRAGLGIYVCDVSGRCISISPLLAELFGTSESEMLSYGWTASVEDSVRAYKHWQFCVEHQLPYHDEYKVVPKNGAAPFEAITEAIPMRKKDGSILCYVGYVIKKS